MQAYEDIISLFDLTVSDLASRRTLMSKREEILLRFDLTEEVTITIKDRELDRNAVIQLFETFSQNIDSYQQIQQVEGLNHFLATGDFLGLDLQALKNISPEFKEWLKPFFNHAYYEAGVLYIEDDTDVDLQEFRRVEKKLAGLKQAIGRHYLEEGQQAIDGRWRNRLLYYKERFLKNKPISRASFLDVYPEVTRVTAINRGRLLTQFSYPYNRGRVAFDSFLTTFINFSIDAVRGNMTKYKTPIVRYLLKIAKHLESESSIRMNGYKEIRQNLEQLSYRRDYSSFRNIVIIVAILFCGGTILKNSGCGPKRAPTPRVEVVNKKYDPITNTLNLEFRRRVMTSNDQSGDEILEYGMEIFKRYFPDTTTFTIVGQVVGKQQDIAIRRKIVKDTSGYQVLPTFEDSVFLAQPMTLNYDFEAAEGLKIDLSYVIKEKEYPGQKKDPMKGFKLGYAEYLILDRDSLLVPGYYIANDDDPEFSGRLGMLNDFFLLKDRVLKVEEPLTIPLPANQASRFFYKKDSVSVVLENGVNLESFLAVVKSGKKNQVIYSIDRSTKKIQRISNRRINSWFGFNHNYMQRINLNDDPVNKKTK